ncbi:PREDICTED: coiled-coil domain-containing protein 181 isoform X1 [Hipposideros armiger]|uniref:Coiled-coil domain-containing protein 181 n=2 Tax=Hipposideros armiger TaxID=186990 RepID=A0A8B7RV27_HIPAR|nr:PREDICTED: coiled-coil domain-containing protein 181 isoform X1 [Hipposideros armiger]XP_019502995.1 PREDICTED: coiled-coil domain-containing protein 181 isoform X1 [Hipposideros armiger]XP_019503010.1 PREDICTED: coiled-coil domain-containing protein 181 isoform X1 [Hipposideros armiger]XP_019503021.1 PREDICTED: coiled-coil domain-containing protein 181 isoform X1 [Hipposideros armiger]
MDENKDSDSRESEEYEDDFEKDLEWLINEKEKSGVSIIEMACGNEETINQELKENETGLEHAGQLSDPDTSLKDEFSPRREDFVSVPGSQPSDPVSDSDSENSFQEARLESRKDLEEDEDEEVRRYIMEKIVRANQLLQNQEPVNDKRERKLKFKDKLVDLEVPPLEGTDNYRNYFESESEVSRKLSQLCISSEFGQENVFLSFADESCEENKDRKVLVERDGKFELLNLQDIESQGFLPSIHNVNGTESEPQQLSPGSTSSSDSGVRKEQPTAGVHGPSAEEALACLPLPSPNPKTGPSSAANSDPTKGSGKSSHRTQSTSTCPVTSTYCLSPRQKELQKRLEQKREKLKREEEQQKIEEEKEKKKENDMVFKAWLQKKRQQILEMRRVQRAKQMEDMNNREESRDPHQAFRRWLKKKHEARLKERKTEELRKQEECLFFLKGTEGRERAFKQWLRRKQIEKLLEQEALKERTRQLRLEAKRSKQLQNQLYNISEARPFRFTDDYN